MAKTLTIRQLSRACDRHRFILVRYPDNEQIGINTKVSNILLNKHKFDLDQETRFISFAPCSFQTYISKKPPFVTE